MVRRDKKLTRLTVGVLRRRTFRSAPVPEVYPEREDTDLLRPFARAPSGQCVLDLGTGNGALALAAARAGARVVATDRNPHALRALAGRARDAGLDVGVVRTDLFAGTRTFDRILANPPYLPTAPGEEDPDEWHDLALNGGPDGCAVTARILAEVLDHLVPAGRAFLLVSSVQSRERLRALVDEFERAGGTVREVASRPLEGERLMVWELARSRATQSVRRTARSPRGTRVRRRTPPRRPGGSSRGPALGRTRARGGA